MLNFTVGPVQIDSDILQMGAEQVPYFRTPEFSALMLENERIMKVLSKAPEDARAVFITGSGTAAMEAVIMNCFQKKDRVLVVNGGSFGARFCVLCELHQIPYTEIKLEYGEVLTEEKLLEYDGGEYTGFIVNIHETSTGVYYDPVIIHDFCKRNQLFLAVDAVSSFLADSFEMKQWGVNAMLTGSQKALAVPPGVSVVVLDQEAVERVQNTKCASMYLDLKNALKDGERGQTPFTPAVGILLQMNRRLKQIEETGLEQEQKRIAALAEDFRGRIKALPVTLFSGSMSNAVTALKVSADKDAYQVFEILKEEYNIWVCPNGGELAHSVFRVGHIGALSLEDNTCLVNALYELAERGVL